MLNFIRRSLAKDCRNTKVARAVDLFAETVKAVFLAGTMLFWGFVLSVALPDMVAVLTEYLLTKAQEGTPFAGTLYNVRGLGLLATLVYTTSMIWGWSSRIVGRKDECPERDFSSEKPHADAVV